MHILMLTVSLSASGSLVGSKNGRAGLSLEFFSPSVGGASTFVRLLFDIFALALVLEFIIHAEKRIASNITLPQLVNCGGAGLKIDY